ncbi:conserved hypothetical protein [Trichinella spiralis]|uniref:hypothetical protein n=1 Tax=Trichinella spiralis TaxID=6334 RepID=UPI0001EFC67F|nr:conserved hypothetical protein [Trichinella spiralis]
MLPQASSTAQQRLLTPPSLVFVGTCIQIRSPGSYTGPRAFRSLQNFWGRCSRPAFPVPPRRADPGHAAAAACTLLPTVLACLSGGRTPGQPVAGALCQTQLGWGLHPLCGEHWTGTRRGLYQGGHPNRQGDRWKPSPIGPAGCGSFASPCQRTAGGRLWPGFWSPQTAGTPPSRVRTRSSCPDQNESSPAPRSGKRCHLPAPWPRYAPPHSAAQTPPATSRTVATLRLLQRTHYVHAHSLEGMADRLKLHRGLELPRRGCPRSARLTCPAPVFDVLPLLGPVIPLAHLRQRLRHPQVGPRLAVVDGGQDLRDPLSRDDLQQPRLARVQGLPHPTYSPFTKDYPVTLRPQTF